MTEAKPPWQADWYGVDAAFWYRIERGSNAHFARMRGDTRGADRLHFAPGDDVLTYRVTGMHVPGYVELHDISVEFYRHPKYPTGALAPQDYPRITTRVDRHYYHQHGKSGAFRGSLCLWHPDAPRDGRWASDQPLYELFEMVRRHLYHEEFYARYGRWPVEHHSHRPPKAAA